MYVMMVWQALLTGLEVALMVSGETLYSISESGISAPMTFESL
jgi:hypothetical protein